MANFSKHSSSNGAAGDDHHPDDGNNERVNTRQDGNVPSSQLTGAASDDEDADHQQQSDAVANDGQQGQQPEQRPSSTSQRTDRHKAGFDFSGLYNSNHAGAGYPPPPPSSAYHPHHQQYLPSAVPAAQMSNPGMLMGPSSAHHQMQPPPPPLPSAAALNPYQYSTPDELQDYHTQLRHQFSNLQSQMAHMQQQQHAQQQHQQQASASRSVYDEPHQQQYHHHQQQQPYYAFGNYYNNNNNNYNRRNHHQHQPPREFDETNVYVSHLPIGMTHEEFFELMSKFGTVMSSRILIGDRWQRRGVKGVGFSRMSNEEEALVAIKGVNNLRLPGCTNVLRARLAFKTIRPASGHPNGEYDQHECSSCRGCESRASSPCCNYAEMPPYGCYGHPSMAQMPPMGAGPIPAYATAPPAMQAAAPFGYNYGPAAGPYYPAPHPAPPPAAPPTNYMPPSAVPSQAGYPNYPSYPPSAGASTPMYAQPGYPLPPPPPPPMAPPMMVQAAAAAAPNMAPWPGMMASPPAALPAVPVLYGPAAPSPVGPMHGGFHQQPVMAPVPPPRRMPMRSPAYLLAGPTAAPASFWVPSAVQHHHHPAQADFCTCPSSPGPETVNMNYPPGFEPATATATATTVMSNRRNMRNYQPASSSPASVLTGAAADVHRPTPPPRRASSSNRIIISPPPSSSARPAAATAEAEAEAEHYDQQQHQLILTRDAASNDQQGEEADDDTDGGGRPISSPARSLEDASFKSARSDTSSTNSAEMPAPSQMQDENISISDADVRDDDEGDDEDDRKRRRLPAGICDPSKKSSYFRWLW